MPIDRNEDANELTPVQVYWRERYRQQRDMESKTLWRYCPWCGEALAITPLGHICGEPDID
jgi:hypothetical protein